MYMSFAILRLRLSILHLSNAYPSYVNPSKPLVSHNFLWTGGPEVAEAAAVYVLVWVGGMEGSVLTSYR